MIRHLLLLWLFLLPSLLPAQASAPASYAEEPMPARQLDREQWASAKEGIQYSGEARRAAEEKKRRQSNTESGGGEEPPPPEPPRQSRPLLDGQLADALVKILFFIAIAVGIAFLARYLLGLQQRPRNEKVRPSGSSAEIDLEQIEEELHEAELGDYLQRAVQDGNYRLAIRLHYLSVLKELSLRELLVWKKDKTNRQYWQELNQVPELQPAFAQVTRIFEHYWYGNHEMSAEDYGAVAPYFQQLGQQIKAYRIAHAK